MSSPCCRARCTHSPSTATAPPEATTATQAPTKPASRGLAPAPSLVAQNPVLQVVLRPPLSPSMRLTICRTAAQASSSRQTTAVTRSRRSGNFTCQRLSILLLYGSIVIAVPALKAGRYNLMMKRKTLLPARKTNLSNLPLRTGKQGPLLEQTTKMEQKILRLKQQISERKKSLKHTPPAPGKKSNADPELAKFIQDIGMDGYTQMLLDNGIDSFEVLKQIKQKQLEEIGVAKGHALKIMVSLKKSIEQHQKQARRSLSSAETAQNTHRVTSKAAHQVHPHTQPAHTQPALQMISQSHSCQTSSQPLPRRRYFCLYCYQVADAEYCGPDCRDLYDRMFEKYERNLDKVQKMFGGKLERVEYKEEEEQEDEGDFISDIGFLDLLGTEEKAQMDSKQYKQALSLIRSTKQQLRQQAHDSDSEA